jgi:histidinol-phosphate aminotransferase
MASAIGPRTKLMFVCNPNNPTGTIVTQREVANLMAAVPDQVIVCFDEAYLEFVDSPDYPLTLPYIREGRKNVIVLRTFSKIYGMAGLRLGYGVASPELLAPMRASQESFPVNRLAQAAGLAALEDEEFLQQTVQMNRAGREYLYREFRRLGLDFVPSHTNFVLLHIGAGAKAVIQCLLEQGVIVRPCGGYDLPGYARVTVGTAAQNERFIHALEVALQRSWEPVRAG